MELFKLLSEKVAFHKQRPDSIEALAHGIFAITMTLLVLDIQLPEMNRDNDAWLSLKHSFPKIATFILSFTVVGLFWTVFTNQFNYIKVSDRRENIIALFYLMFVSLFPFSTSFLSDNLTSNVAVGFYIVNNLVVLLMNLLHWLYSYHHGLVQIEENRRAVIHKAVLIPAKISITAQALLLGCCFFSSAVALYGTFFLQIIFTFNGYFELLYSMGRKKLIRAKSRILSKYHKALPKSSLD